MNENEQKAPETREPDAFDAPLAGTGEATKEEPAPKAAKKRSAPCATSFSPASRRRT